MKRNEVEGRHTNFLSDVGPLLERENPPATSTQFRHPRNHDSLRKHLSKRSAAPWMPFGSFGGGNRFMLPSTGILHFIPGYCGMRRPMMRLKLASTVTLPSWSSRQHTGQISRSRLAPIQRYGDSILSSPVHRHSVSPCASRVIRPFAHCQMYPCIYSSVSLTLQQLSVRSSVYASEVLFHPDCVVLAALRGAR